MSRILKFALLVGLLVGTAVLAAPPSSNPIQSFTADPSIATAVIDAAHAGDAIPAGFLGSQDGKAVDTEYGEFTASENGIFEVSVGPTSAFLLTLKKRGHEFEDSERFSHSLRVTPKRVKLAFVTKNSSDQ